MLSCNKVTKAEHSLMRLWCIYTVQYRTKTPKDSTLVDIFQCHFVPVYVFAERYFNYVRTHEIRFDVYMPFQPKIR